MAAISRDCLFLRIGTLNRLNRARKGPPVALFDAGRYLRRKSPSARVASPQRRQRRCERATLRLHPRCESMADDTADAPRLTTEQYRELAKLIRQTAATTSRSRVQGLVDTARLYDELADIADSRKLARSSG